MCKRDEKFWKFFAIELQDYVILSSFDTFQIFPRLALNN